MIDRYIKFLGLAETIALLKANNRPLIHSIRVNTLKIEVSHLKDRLHDLGFILTPIDWVPYGFTIQKEVLNLGSLHEFLQGYFYLQNVASMLPAIILDPKPNELIIDMCAAPGSKSTQLAQIMGNMGKLILIEKRRNRIPSLEFNLRRMGITNSIILNLDAKSLPKLNIQADKILLDAPCTGEGLIRQDQSRKRSRTFEDIDSLIKVQKRLLQAGLKSLKSGGQLLYSTCSIGPEENELIIDSVLSELNEYKIKEIKTQYGVNGLTNVYGKTLIADIKLSQRLYPHIHDTIGFYICLIERA